MKNIKKVLVYPLAFVLFFGLTANECLDSLEDVSVDVPTEIIKTFQLVSDENGDFVRMEEIDLTSEEIDEYRDRINDFTAESLDISVTDNLSGGSSPSTGQIEFKYDGQSQVMQWDSQNEMIPTLEAIKMANLPNLKAYIEAVLKDPTSSGEKIDVEMSMISNGSFDYTVEIVIKGIVDAKAN